PDPARIVLCRGTPPARAARAAPVAGAAAAAPVAPAAPADADADPRSIALNHGSRLLLERLGAWPALGADIHAIHVSQRGRLGRTIIRDSDFGVPALGSVHAYGRLQAALHQALRRAGVTLREVSASLVREDADGVTIAQGSDTWHSRLA